MNGVRFIKFRVWSIFDKEYGSVKLINFNSQYIEMNGADTLKFDQIILKQYTGLKDKNGVEIYENDKVRYDNHTFYIKWWLDQYVMKDINSENNLYLTSGILDMDTRQFDNIEVIGNIHQ